METLLQLPVTLDVAGLAALLGLNPRTIYNILSTRPWRLPTPVARLPKQRLVWLTSDVLAWLRGQQVPSAPPSLRRKIGRPKKAEQLARQSVSI